MVVTNPVVVQVGPLLWVVWEPVFEVVVPVSVGVWVPEYYLYLLDVVTCHHLDTVACHLGSVVAPGSHYEAGSVMGPSAEGAIEVERIGILAPDDYVTWVVEDHLALVVDCDVVVEVPALHHYRGVPIGVVG